ncbi:MAG TPA: hypothetical protein VFT53_03260 [Candidatus Saccharimonadales bacterium]|nr:hypothetical protein [Candidatus Saccharimonadales bacterium]
MFKNLFTFFCESSSVDGSDGKLSAYKFFEDFSVPVEFEDKVHKGAMLQFRFDLVSSWLISDPSSRPIKLSTVKKVINPDGEKIGEIVAPLELAANQIRFNIRDNISALPIKGYGDYTMELTLSEEGKTVGRVRYPFRVVPSQASVSARGGDGLL